MTVHEQDRQGYKALTAALETKYKSRKTQYCESGRNRWINQSINQSIRVFV